MFGPGESFGPKVVFWYGKRNRELNIAFQTLRVSAIFLLLHIYYFPVLAGNLPFSHGGSQLGSGKIACTVCGDSLGRYKLMRWKPSAWSICLTTERKRCQLCHLPVFLPPGRIIGVRRRMVLVKGRRSGAHGPYVLHLPLIICFHSHVVLHDVILRSDIRYTIGLSCILLIGL